jgi:hypothetical protein
MRFLKVIILNQVKIRSQNAFLLAIALSPDYILRCVYRYIQQTTKFATIPHYLMSRRKREPQVR